MNWEVVMWILITVFMLMSIFAWKKAFEIPLELWKFAEWETRHVFFMYGVPVIFIALLIGKFW